MALTVNLDSQIVVQTAAAWAADTTVYSAKRILVTSDATYTGTDQRKFKIADGVQTWSNLDYMPLERTLAQVLAAGNNTNNVNIVSPDNTGALAVQSGGYCELSSSNLDATESYVYLDPTTAALMAIDGATGINIDASQISATHGTKITLAAPNINLSSETASRVAIFDASKNLKAADTATYPSLTELSYVKGVTSAIQTQLGTKLTSGGALGTPSSGTLTNCTGLPIAGVTGYQGYSLNGGIAAAVNPADSTNYYIGSYRTTLSAIDGATRIIFPKAGTLKTIYTFVRVGGTLGSNENVPFNFRLNSTTDTFLGNQTWDATTITGTYTGLNISVVAGDYGEIYIPSPAWGTNPTTVTIYFAFYLE